jgi:hypothetical protein
MTEIANTDSPGRLLFETFGVGEIGESKRSPEGLRQTSDLFRS